MSNSCVPPSCPPVLDEHRQPAIDSPQPQTGRTMTMDSRRMVWTKVGLAAGLALAMSTTIPAQERPRGVPEPYTPAKDAKDLKSVLFNWMRNEGMLKGHDERDMVAMLEYQG